MKVLAGLLLVLAVEAAGTLGSSPTPEAEIESVKALMAEINAAWESEDIEVFSKIVAHDATMVNFGTDVSDRWVGWDALEGGLYQQFGLFSETKIAPHHTDVRLSSGNTVAWLAQDMTMSTSLLGSPVLITLEARITAVFEKRDRGWKLVHFHYSVPLSECSKLGL